MEAGASTALPLVRPSWRLRRREAKVQQTEDADTAELVERIKSGHPTLFDLLYERYFDRVYGYLALLLRDRHEAEDAAQQVFTQVLEALPRYERRSVPFRAWLFRIARNEGLMRLRKHRRVDVTEPAVIESRLNGSSAANGTDPGLAAAGFMELIERLPDSQRQVLMLRYMLDLPPDEIATVIGRTPGAVRKIHHRAVRRLEGELEGDERVPHAARRRRRAPMLVRLRRVPVLRSRRFALFGGGNALAPGFTPMLGRHPYRSFR